MKSKKQKRNEMKILVYNENLQKQAKKTTNLNKENTKLDSSNNRAEKNNYSREEKMRNVI